MPANLTPAYEKAEQRYREAVSDEDKLDALREMLSTIPKHKGTEKLQADLKRRISQARKAGSKKAVKGADPFHVPRSGAGQVVLVGPPNVGKSAIVAATTKAQVKVAPYPFTTQLPQPGMAHFEDVQIQLVDTPPITAEHVPPGLHGTVRAGDIIAVVVDANEPLEGADLALGILEERGLILRSVLHSELDHSNPHEHAALLIVNKMDEAPPENIDVLRELYGQKIEIRPISAQTGQGMPDLIARFWQMLCLIRVYTKQPGHPPDMQKPFALEIGSTVEDLANEIHRELTEKMKFARIWREGKFSGQQVHRTEVLHDRDVVEIHE
jgi:ribosome-interacting GTPase 1